MNVCLSCIHKYRLTIRTQRGPQNVQRVLPDLGQLEQSLRGPGRISSSHVFPAEYVNNPLGFLIELCDPF